MRKHGRQIDDAGDVIDRRSLHGRDFTLAQGLAHDVEPARKRRITELPGTALPAMRLDRADQRLLRIDELDLRFGERSGERSYR